VWGLKLDADSLYFKLIHNFNFYNLSDHEKAGKEKQIVISSPAFIFEQSWLP